MYNVQRRGPKWGNGCRQRRMRSRRLEQGTTSSPQDSVDASQYDSCPTTTTNAGQQSVSHLSPHQQPNRNYDTESFGTEGFGTESFSIAVGISDLSPEIQFPFESRSERISAVIMAHIGTFMTHMFPIMPAVTGAQLMSDAANLQSLSVPRYTLLLALCAMTRIQLRLDQEEPLSEDPAALHAQESEMMSGSDFLAATELWRRQFTLVENVSQEAVMTSFFLFVSYGNLEKYNEAWFYLSQSINMAIGLGYDRESPDMDLSPEELNMRRKIFWLLFITER